MKNDLIHGLLGREDRRDEENCGDRPMPPGISIQ